MPNGVVIRHWLSWLTLQFPAQRSARFVLTIFIHCTVPCEKGTFMGGWKVRDKKGVGMEGENKKKG